jgi:phage regulator Rha-like protein
MSSLEIAKLTGKQHKDVLKAIRNMEPAWVKVTEGNFALSEYLDSTGRFLNKSLKFGR